MHCKGFLFFICCLLLIQSTSLCQISRPFYPTGIIKDQIRIDSLIKKVNNSKSNKQQLNLLKSLAWELRNFDPKGSIEYVDKGLTIAKKVNDYKSTCDLLRYKGLILFYFLDNTASLDYLTESLELATSNNYPDGVGFVYDILAAIYIDLGRDSSAIEYLNKAFSIFKSNNNALGLGYVYTHWGKLKAQANEVPKAMEYYQLALAERKKINAFDLMVNSGIDISDTYLKLNKVDSAIYWLQKCDTLSRQSNNQILQTALSKWFAEAYYRKKDMRLAKKYALQGHLFGLQNKQTIILASTSYILSGIYMFEGDKNEAVKMALMHDSCHNLMLEESVKRNKLITDTNFSLREKWIKETSSLEKQKQVYLLIIIGLLVIGLAYYMSKKQQLKILLDKLIQKNTTIEQANKNLMNLEVAKNRMFYILSHDLRSPLTNIQSIITLTASEHFSYEDWKNTLPLLIKSTNHTLDMMDNIIYWANMKLAKDLPQAEAVKLSEIIQSQIKKHDLQLQSKVISITYKCIDNDIAMCYGVIVELVIRNLIANAIKYCNINDKITILTKPIGDKIMVSVKDTGVGITEAIKEKLFKEFVYETGTKQEKGLGLGLIVCKYYIEKYGGNLWVSENKANKSGTEILFTLPTTT